MRQYFQKYGIIRSHDADLPTRGSYMMLLNIKSSLVQRIVQEMHPNLTFFSSFMCFIFGFGESVVDVN